MSKYKLVYTGYYDKSNNIFGEIFGLNKFIFLNLLQHQVYTSGTAIELPCFFLCLVNFYNASTLFNASLMHFETFTPSWNPSLF